MRSRLVGLGVAAAALLVFPATSIGSVIDVFPGDSIQRAVRQAGHGDVIKVHEGVYRQSVQIRKNGLTVKGAGPDRKDGTVIKPGKTKRCFHASAGVCILSHRKGDRRVRTQNTKLKGFLIKGFGGFGAIAIDGKNTTFLRNKFVDNDEYGAAAFSSNDSQFLRNVATGSLEAGFYVGDSKQAEALLRGNKARGNGQFGFFIRDSAHGAVLNNEAVHNCMGIGLLDTGAPNQVRRWRVRNNEASKNDRFCEGEGGGPSISGTGIGVLGARRSVIRNNSVRRNQPKQSAPFAGGIVLASTAPFGGGPAEHNLVKQNHAFNNVPADLRWDGQGDGNRFRRNRCDTSQPSGLCG